MTGGREIRESIMNNMLLLNRLQTYIPDLYQDSPAGMLPILDKPMVEYTLERLAENGVNKVTIAVSNITNDFVKTLGDGIRWGIELDYVNTDVPTELAQYIESGVGTYCLIDGDIAIDSSIDEMLSVEQFNQQDASDINPSMTYVQDANAAEEMIRFGAVRATLPSQAMELLSRFHAQNITVLENPNDDLVIAGHLRDATRNIHVQQGGNANTESATGSNVFVGKLSDVHASCQIQNNVVIGEGAVIDADVSLDNTVVLPNTHVGEQLDLTNCLVSSRWVFNIITQGLIKITDPALITKTA